MLAALRRTASSLSDPDRAHFGDIRPQTAVQNCIALRMRQHVPSYFVFVFVFIIRPQTAVQNYIALRMRQLVLFCFLICQILHNGFCCLSILSEKCKQKLFKKLA